MCWSTVKERNLVFFVKVVTGTTKVTTTTKLTTITIKTMYCSPPLYSPHRCAPGICYINLPYGSTYIFDGCLNLPLFERCFDSSGSAASHAPHAADADAQVSAAAATAAALLGISVPGQWHRKRIAGLFGLAWLGWTWLGLA